MIVRGTLAIEYHRQHLVAIAKEVCEGMAYGKLGNAYQSLEDFSKAIEYHGKHLVAIAKEVGDRAGEGHNKDAMGWSQGTVGSNVGEKNSLF